MTDFLFVARQGFIPCADQDQGSSLKARQADRRRQLLCEEVRAAMHPQGALLIPSFAVERAQELISDLGRLIAEAVRARIRSLDLYSGHADGTELRDWIKERLPIRHQVFLVHGEEPAMAGLAARLDGIIPLGIVLQPNLDEGFVLTPDGAESLARTTPPRLSPEKVAHLDCSVVIMSHRPGLEDYFLGSTAGRVVRHAQCSVHVVR